MILYAGAYLIMRRRFFRNERRLKAPFANIPAMDNQITALPLANSKKAPVSCLIGTLDISLAVTGCILLL